MIDFLEKHPIIAKIIYFPVGIALLFWALKDGLLGFITGKTELITRYRDNYPLESHWSVPLISFFSLYIGLFLGIMMIALALGYKDVRKYYQNEDPRADAHDIFSFLRNNKILQALFVISFFGYILILVLYPFVYP